MSVTETINVEIAYARPDEQLILKVNMNAGCRVEDLVKQSGILERFPDIDMAKNRVGIFGKLTTMDAVLRSGDRVEIYRALIADPKEIRRQRAAEGKKMKKG